MSQEEWLNLVHPQDRRKHFHEVKKFLQNPSQEIFRSEYRVQGKDGKYLWVSTHGKVQERNKDGIPTLVIGRHTDISDRKIKEDTITYQESHDGLTHLLNRNAFLASVDSKLR